MGEPDTDGNDDGKGDNNMPAVNNKAVGVNLSTLPLSYSDTLSFIFLFTFLYLQFVVFLL